MLTLSEFAARLRGVKWSGDEKFTALCAGHEDGSQSLSVTRGDDGRLLLKCHTGCDARRILDAMSLEWSDVLPEREWRRKEYPAQKTERSWTIRDASGAAVAEHVRIDQGGKKSFIWRRNGKSGLDGLPVADVPLYRSESVAAGVGSVVVCEGEKAADAAAALGLVAVGTTCGAAATPGRGVLEVLRGRDVILWPDNDAIGAEHMERVEKALRDIASSVRWLHIPNAAPKADAADYRGTKDELRGLIRAKQVGPLVMFSDRIRSAEAVLERLHVGDFSRFVTTGITKLDRNLGGGFGRGQVTLIGAPTGSGKTTLVVQIAMAAQENGLVVVVSPEMSVDELVVREVVRRSGKPKHLLAPWNRNEAERAAALAEHAKAIGELNATPPNVAAWDSSTVSLSEVAEHVRLKAKREPVSMVALDYAQQLADDNPQRARHLQVGDVAARAIDIAREHDCAVIITSQVNSYKVGKETEYSYRESQSLEQKVPNALLFIVERDEAGNVKSAQFRARKVRDGALFRLPVKYSPALFRIEDEPEVTDFTGVETRDWGNR